MLTMAVRETDTMPTSLLAKKCASALSRAGEGFKLPLAGTSIERG